MLGDIFVYELPAKLPMIQSYHSCFRDLSQSMSLEFQK